MTRVVLSPVSCPGERVTIRREPRAWSGVKQGCSPCGRSQMDEAANQPRFVDRLRAVMSHESILPAREGEAARRANKKHSTDGSGKRSVPSVVVGDRELFSSLNAHTQMQSNNEPRCAPIWDEETLVDEVTLI